MCNEITSSFLCSFTSTEKNGATAKKTVFPKGIWEEFNFDDVHEVSKLSNVLFYACVRMFLFVLVARNLECLTRSYSKCMS